MRAKVACAESVRADDLVDAAWAALISGRAHDLHVLEELLARPVEMGQAARAEGLELRASVRRLEILLGATARNLRILRGQYSDGTTQLSF